MRFILFLLITYYSLCAGAQLSKVSDVLVRADEMVHDSESQRLDLDGEVQLIYGDFHLYAQKVTVDLNTKSIVAIGQVSLLTSDSSMDADRLDLNYVTGKGVATNSFVKSGNVSFEGDIIHKVGAKEYEIENGTYTACRSCPPAWSFSGKRIKAELGGYAFISQPIFRIVSYPFFWLPYLIVPLKSKRQSGFLFPSFSSSTSGGFAIEERFFWAINDHKDLTVSLKNYSLRGLKPKLNYRFFADVDSFGEFSTAFIKDKVFPSSSRLSPELQAEETIDRWYIKYDQHFNLPGDIIQRTKLTLMSDLQYMTDFPEESNIGRLNGDPALENRISLTKNTENWHLSSEAAFYVNLLKSDVKENNDDAVHRLPDIQISMAERQINESRFTTRLDVNYVNFARNNFGFDDITFNATDTTTKRFNATRDGEFNFDGATSQDQIRAGQRFDIKPSIARPFTLGPFLDVLPSLTLRYTTYDFGIGEDSSADRSYARTNLSVRSTMQRVYDNDEPYESKYKHEIIPEISYSYVPFAHQEDHPFFGTATELENFRSNQPVSDDDFFGDTSLQFDYEDRITDRNLITLSMTNTITEKKPYFTKDGKAIERDDPYKQIALLRVSQSYDVLEAREGAIARPWSDIEIFADLRFNSFNSNTTINYFPYQDVSNISSRSQFNFGNKFIQGIYNVRYIVDNNQEVNLDTRSETLSTQFGWSTEYFDLIAAADYSITTSNFTAWRYNLALKPPGDCWGIVFNHNQPIGGEPTFGFNFSYSFDGKTKKGFTKDQLDSY